MERTQSNLFTQEMMKSGWSARKCHWKTGWQHWQSHFGRKLCIRDDV